MATVTPRTDRKGMVICHQVKLRRKGFAPVPASKMFDSERTAKRWAEAMEQRMDDGEFCIVEQRTRRNKAAKKFLKETLSAQ